MRAKSRPLKGGGSPLTRRHAAKLTLRLGTRGSKLAWFRRKWSVPHWPRTAGPARSSFSRRRRPHPGPVAGRRRRQGTLRQGDRRRAVAGGYRSRRPFDEGHADGSARRACARRRPAARGSERGVSRRTMAKTFAQLPSGARVGTSSVRRRTAQVARLRPDLEIVLVRGNVDTRLRKLEDGEMRCHLSRLCRTETPGPAGSCDHGFPPSDWLPSLGSGRGWNRNSRSRYILPDEALGFLNHTASEIALTCERAFQAALDGSCRTPIAGLATIEGDTLIFRGEVLAPDGSDFLRNKFCDCSWPKSARGG